MRKTVIFDFGNVLAHFDPIYMTSVYIKDTEDQNLVYPILFDRKYWNRLDAGTMTDEEVKEAVCRQVPQRLWDAVCRIQDHWFEHLPPVEGMAELVKELKAQGTQIYLLSNISPRFARNYHRVPQLAELFSCFDGLVFSGLLQITKPDHAIFKHLLTKYALTPEMCVFVDDNADNVKAARECGLCAYLFDGDAQKLRAFLQTV